MVLTAINLVWNTISQEWLGNHISVLTETCFGIDYPVGMVWQLNAWHIRSMWSSHAPRTKALNSLWLNFADVASRNCNNCNVVALQPLENILCEVVLYPACFLKMAADIWKTVWETEPTFLVQWCLFPKILNIQSDHYKLWYCAIMTWSVLALKVMNSVSIFPEAVQSRVTVNLTCVQQSLEQVNSFLERQWLCWMAYQST